VPAIAVEAEGERLLRKERVVCRYLERGKGDHVVPVYKRVGLTSANAIPSLDHKPSSDFPYSSHAQMSKPSTPQPSNTLLLRRQLTELTKRPVEGFSAGTDHPPLSG